MRGGVRGMGGGWNEEEWRVRGGGGGEKREQKNNHSSQILVCQEMSCTLQDSCLSKKGNKRKSGGERQARKEKGMNATQFCPPFLSSLLPL